MPRYQILSEVVAEDMDKVEQILEDSWEDSVKLRELAENGLLTIMILKRILIML